MTNPPARNSANIISIEELLAALPAKARLLGLDLGTKTIGLGLSDVERRIASPLETKDSAQLNHQG